jgi:hypothetical protein
MIFCDSSSNKLRYIDWIYIIITYYWVLWFAAFYLYQHCCELHLYQNISTQFNWLLRITFWIHNFKMWHLGKGRKTMFQELEKPDSIHRCSLVPVNIDLRWVAAKKPELHGTASLWQETLGHHYSFLKKTNYLGSGPHWPAYGRPQKAVLEFHSMVDKALVIVIGLSQQKCPGEV